MKIFSTLFIVSSLVGQEMIWQENGVPIRQGVHIEWQRTLCSAEPGNMIFVWSDTRYGSRNVFAQKVDSSGSLLWGNSGTAVTNLPGRQEDPVAITDGSGGAFISWVDYRFDEEGDIYIQHIDNQGNRMMDDGGAALARIDGRHLTINMCTDSLGGVFVTWQDKRNLLDDDIYGTHVSSSYEIISPSSGVPIIQMNGNQGAKSLEYAGNNEATIIWSDTRSGSGNDIYCQKINMNMEKIFDEEGLAVSTTSDLETTPRTTYMKNDTSFIIWQSGTESTDIYYNLLTSNGLVFSEPLQLCTYSSSKASPRVKRNQLGHVFVQWTDYRNDLTEGNHYYQKISNGGSIIWDQDGVQLDQEGDDHHARFSPGMNGEVYIYWERGTFPNVDIMYQAIQSDGLLLLDSAEYISNISGYQSMPNTISDNNNGSFVVFSDQSNGSIDLRVQRMNTDIVSFETNGLIAMYGLDGDIEYPMSNYMNDNVLINWVDARNGKKVFGSIVGEDGVNSSLVNGQELTQFDSYTFQLENEPVSLLAHNYLFTAAFDAQSGAKLIRINKFNLEFQMQWPDEGLVVHQSNADQRKVKLFETYDGIGVVWSEIRDEIDFDLFYQRFDLDGQIEFDSTGVTLLDGIWTDNYVEGIYSTPDSSFILVWVDDVWGAGSLKFQKYNLDGGVADGWPNDGYTLSSTGDPEKLKGKVINSVDGILVSWEESYNFNKNIKANIIHWDGTLEWSNGLVLTSAENDQINLELAIDESSQTSLVIWEDFQNGNDLNIVGQFIDLSNKTLLNENIIICDDEVYQQSPVLKSVDDGYYLIAWEDERGFLNNDPVLSGGLDIYAQVVHYENGNVYLENGIALCQEYHDQKGPKISLMKDNQDNSQNLWFVHWIDMRSSGKADLANLYGQTIRLSAPMNIGISYLQPSSFEIGAAFPNPFNNSISIEINISNLEPIEFLVANVLGEVVYNEKIIPLRNGIHSLTWNARNNYGQDLSSGIYFFQFNSINYQSNRKITYLK
ncbi:MAG: T9SS type A sorting domain-containing protein [Candidatus Neomarinimicrobiota bacterium]|nr:T9SS type A sorting domain-containing protein [Candidatus Neomarinimicrobiota bacterium]